MTLLNIYLVFQPSLGDSTCLCLRGASERPSTLRLQWRTRQLSAQPRICRPFTDGAVIHKESSWHEGRPWRRTTGPISWEQRGGFSTLLKPADVCNSSSLGTSDWTAFGVDRLNSAKLHPIGPILMEPRLISSLRLRHCLRRCNMSALEKVLPVHILLSIPIENRHMVEAAPSL